MKPLSLLHLLSVRWWNAGAYYAITLADGLARRGHRVVVAGLAGSPAMERAEAIGLQTAALHTRLFFQSIRDLRALAEQEGIDLVDAHRSEDHACAALVLRGVGRRVPLVRTVSDARRPKRHPLNRWLHRRATDFHIASACAVKRVYVEDLGLDPDRVAVIHGGLDVRAFTNSFPHGRGTESGMRSGRLRGALSIPPDAPLFGVIARLSPEKGHRVFIEAAAQVSRRCPEARFLIAGEEAQIREEKLRDYAGRLGVADPFHFTGRWADVRQVIADLDVGVIPSLRSEAVCRVAAEYMAMGRPVIGAAVNVIPEMVVHGVTGFVVPPGDAGALAEAMGALAEDRAKAARMGEMGRSRAMRCFDMDRVVDETETVFRKVLRFPDEG